MTDLLLVTCQAWPDGEPGHDVLDRALAQLGVDARWVVWDDPAVDWGSALVAVRSTWDYEVRREQFLDWARTVPRMLNGADVFAWNTDKVYLSEMATTGVPVVPTLAVDGEAELGPALATVWDQQGVPAVVKPRVGAGGRGVVVMANPQDEAGGGGPVGTEFPELGPGPWIVQPLVESVRTEGESSVFVLGGRVVSGVRKLPGGDEIRVHEYYGGSTEPVPVSLEASELALAAVGAAERLLDTRLHYARVDQMRLADGRLALSELEATEPGLYLEELPENGPGFAEVVARVLGH